MQVVWDVNCDSIWITPIVVGLQLLIISTTFPFLNFKYIKNV
jgi:hypothetical protein